MNNIEAIVFWLCMTVLVVLCAGTPDLLDAITANVRGRCG